MKKLLRAACALVTCVGLSCTVCAADSSLFDRIYNHVEENAPHTKAPAEAAGTDLTAAFDAFTKDAVSYAEEKGVAVKQIVKKKAVKFSDEKIEAEIRRWFGREKGDIYEEEFADIKSAVVLGRTIYLDSVKTLASGEFVNIYYGVPGTVNEEINLEALCEVLALCPELNALRISYCKLTDITPLEKFNPTLLILDHNKIESIDPIAGMTRLTDFRAENNAITDLDALADMTALKTCYVMYNNISDISGLAGKPVLSNLRLSFNPVSDLSPLSDAVKLKTFEAQECEISDVSVFENISSLEWVHMPNNSVTDISPFGNSPKIRTLQIGQNQIDDISVVADLPKLTSVHMPNNCISDLSPIAENENIKSLYLNSNEVDDLSPLAGCDHVEQMYLSNNQITDVSPLAEMGGLEYVNLSNNPVKDWRPAMDLAVDVVGIPPDWTPPKEPAK